MNNNAILFTFGLFFLLIAITQPVIRAEFENVSIANNADILESGLGQQDITDNEVLSMLVALFFWVIGAPWYINTIITMMRVMFWVIVWDKIRGIGS